VRGDPLLISTGGKFIGGDGLTFDTGDDTFLERDELIFATRGRVFVDCDELMFATGGAFVGGDPFIEGGELGTKLVSLDGVEGVEGIVLLEIINLSGELTWLDVIGRTAPVELIGKLISLGSIGGTASVERAKLIGGLISLDVVNIVSVETVKSTDGLISLGVIGGIISTE
jgi:hypothetical protein